ncbi:hypothetical protein [Actinomadura violacea]|uniref:DUF3592 domain-containing protein n=1 Tax=Actinomadura violacea TaxID=2819934 RepID=A0ABS3RUH9_9ACTN|nr:hypothetical protein [Actinomadura violacea]MBO2460421.1 hypothetical protein [Actinomadura violacea]
MVPVGKRSHDRRRTARWAGWAALASYFIAVAIVGGWSLAVAGGAALGAGALCGLLAYVTGVMAWERLRAFGGGLVKAEYSKTVRVYRPAGKLETNWQQRYVHVNAAGRTLTGTRFCSYEGSKARPQRRFWVANGRRPGLQPFWQTLFSPALLFITVPTALAVPAFVLAAVPGALIAAIIGVPQG